MANKRKKAKKGKLKKNKDRLVLYHTANNNVESAASESSRGESFDSGYQEIIQEESDGDDDFAPCSPERTSVCFHTIIFTLENNPSHAQFIPLLETYPLENFIDYKLLSKY